MSVKTQPYSIEDIYNVLSFHGARVEETVFHIDILAGLNYDLNQIFRNNYSIVIFIPNPLENESTDRFDKLKDGIATNQVGHFVLLSHMGNQRLEYFDSFGKEPPVEIKEFAKRNDMRIYGVKIQLQDSNSYICAKYCLLRMQSLPSPLTEFVNILTQIKTLSPDKIVDTLIKTKIEE